MILVLLFFFFSSRRRHTRLQGDWSSDVCSSDLIGQGQLETALRVAAEYRDIFGPDHYFLEVQENGVPEQQIVNQGLREIHKRLGIPLVATNDCHYLRKADAKADRKSTRLNSSHLVISYAVFCLKKKKRARNCYSRSQKSTPTSARQEVTL